MSRDPRVNLGMSGPACLKPHLTLTGRQMRVRWSSLPNLLEDKRIHVLPSEFMVAQLHLLCPSLCWVDLHFATNPLDVLGDAGIDPWLVLLSAPVAPADHAHQSHPVIILTDERTPRISLWLTFTTEKRRK